MVAKEKTPGAEMSALSQPGEAAAWDALEKLDPLEVARRTGARYVGACNTPVPEDSAITGTEPPAGTERDSGWFNVPCLGQEIRLSPSAHTVESPAATGRWLLSALGEYVRPALVWYLAVAADAPLRDRLVAPESMKGGRIFEHGSHRLPLADVAAAYEADPRTLAERMVALEGRRIAYGDLSWEFRPVPLVPVTVVLWDRDEEFKARANLLFDGSAEDVLEVDLLWGLAMTVARATLEPHIEGLGHPEGTGT